MASPKTTCIYKSQSWEFSAIFFHHQFDINKYGTGYEFAPYPANGCQLHFGYLTLCKKRQLVKFQMSIFVLKAACNIREDVFKRRKTLPLNSVSTNLRFRGAPTWWRYDHDQIGGTLNVRLGQ